MKAKRYLSQLKKLDKMIENKLFEREHMLTIATRTTSFSSGDRVQSSGSKSKMADAVDSIVDAERDISDFIKDLIDKKADIIGTIENLNTTEYDILHKIYVQYLSFDDVANECGKSYSWVAMIHGRALKNVQNILDEREKKCVR